MIGTIDPEAFLDTNFKLEKFVVEKNKVIKETGIKFVQNFEVGKINFI